MAISNNFSEINVCNSIIYSTYSRISMTKLEERTEKLIGSFWAKCDSDKFQPAYEHVFREGKTLITISICFGHFFHNIPFLWNKTIKLDLQFRSLNNKVSELYVIKLKVKLFTETG